MKVQIKYKRLIWIIFVILYSGLFFYNCLSPYPNWFFPYLYTIFLILLLCKEYYQRHLFFQPDLLEAHNYLLRGLFALFFYSSFVFGITTIVWWHHYRIGNNPIIPIIGIVLLACSIYVREGILKIKNRDKKTILKFYLSIVLVIFSMAFGYDSYFLLIYGIIFGLPLIFLQIQYYNKQFSIGVK